MTSRVSDLMYLQEVVCVCDFSWKLLVHPCLWSTRKRWRQAGMKKNNCLRRNISSRRKFLSEGSLPLSVFGCFSNINRYSLWEYWRVEADPGLVLDGVYDWTMSSEGRILGVSFFFPLNCKKIVLVRWLDFRDKTAILRLHCPRES